MVWPKIALLLFFALMEGTFALGKTWINLNNNSDIRAICRRGDTLYLGTNGGLLLYDLLSDGVAEKVTCGEFLPSNSIRAIAARGSDLLIGTDAGLAIFRPDKILLYKGRAFKRITCISVGVDGSIYLGTLGRGVTVVREDRLQIILKEDSLLSDKVFSIWQPEESTIYFATSLGLCAFKDSAWVSFQASSQVPRREVRAIVPYTQGSFYVLVKGKGIYLFDGKSARRLPLRGIFKENEVSAITLDADGRLWAAGRYGGIARYQYGEWTHVGSSDEEIRNARWRSAYADTTGAVYFGSAEGLLVSVEEGGMGKRRISSLLPSNTVSAIVEDSAGTVFISNGDRLISLGGDGNLIGKEPVYSILSLAVSPSGELWCSTRWGLFRRQGGVYHELGPDIAGRREVFTALSFDSGGLLWAGTQSGEVYCYDGEAWILLCGPEELGDGPVDKIAVGGEGQVWVLRRSRGVSRFDGASWYNFGAPGPGPDVFQDIAVDNSGRVVLVGRQKVWEYGTGGGWEKMEIPSQEAWGDLTSVAFDEEGRIYLGARHALVIIDGQEVRTFEPQDGPGGYNVASILVDSRSYLWIGFRKDGLSMVKLQNLW